MSKPVTVSIPHRLGKPEAIRRLKSGFDHARANFGSVMTITQESWAGDRLTFDAAVMGQRASGIVDVREDHVLVEVQLPWLLAQLASRVKTLVEKQTTLMLEKK